MPVYITLNISDKPEQFTLKWDEYRLYAAGADGEEFVVCEWKHSYRDREAHQLMMIILSGFADQT